MQNLALAHPNCGDGLYRFVGGKLLLIQRSAPGEKTLIGRDFFLQRPDSQGKKKNGKNYIAPINPLPLLSFDPGGVQEDLAV